jgi:hypothetical protein
MVSVSHQMVLNLFIGKKFEEFIVEIIVFHGFKYEKLQNWRHFKKVSSYKFEQRFKLKESEPMFNISYNKN